MVVLVLVLVLWHYGDKLNICICICICIRGRAVLCCALYGQEREIEKEGIMRMHLTRSLAGLLAGSGSDYSLIELSAGSAKTFASDLGTDTHKGRTSSILIIASVTVTVAVLLHLHLHLKFFSVSLCVHIPKSQSLFALFCIQRTLSVEDGESYPSNLPTQVLCARVGFDNLRLSDSWTRGAKPKSLEVTVYKLWYR